MNEKKKFMSNLFNLNALGRKENFLWRRQNGSLNPVLLWSNFFEKKRSNFPQKGH
jgi:hypothetical protein